MGNKLRSIKLQLAMLCIFKELKRHKVIKQLGLLVDNLLDESKSLVENIETYNAFMHYFFEEHKSSLKAYIAYEILYGKNLITLHLEESRQIEPSLMKQMGVELQLMQQIGECKVEDIKEILYAKAADELEKEQIQNLLEWDTVLDESIEVLGKAHWGEKVEVLLEFYREKGCGEFARYRAFKWEDSKLEKEIKGIDTPDSVTFNDLVGYELQKQDLLHNTKAFLKGYPANNLLLYGARGTGKSSMVKAVLNYFADRSLLRLIEIRKDQLMQIKELINSIKHKPYYFIIFIDDLAFEDKEETYTALKTILEGGVEVKPSNMVIYATSNRRHLIQENISDNELHGKDAVEEKMSLSDRFGMRIGFSSPNQTEYLAIVKGLVKQRGLAVEEEVLKREALKWEMWHNGKSGRTAKQFVDYLEGRQVE